MRPLKFVDLVALPALKFDLKSKGTKTPDPKKLWPIITLDFGNKHILNGLFTILYDLLEGNCEESVKVSYI